MNNAEKAALKSYMAYAKSLARRTDVKDIGAMLRGEIAMLEKRLVDTRFAGKHEKYTDDLAAKRALLKTHESIEGGEE